jgi:hypothetical protein
MPEALTVQYVVLLDNAYGDVEGEPSRAYNPRAWLRTHRDAGRTVTVSRALSGSTADDGTAMPYLATITGYADDEPRHALLSDNPT